MVKLRLVCDSFHNFIEYIDFFSPIFFRRSTDTHTPKLFQCNCAMYISL